jgi:hypothetical protein
MKTLSNIFLKVGMLLALGVQAQAEPISVNLSEKTVTLDVAINKWNLKFSRAGYSEPVVKVLIPELADVTLLDHRNFRENAPCLATFEAKTPEEVIQNRFGVEFGGLWSDDNFHFSKTLAAFQKHIADFDADFSKLNKLEALAQLKLEAE